MSIDDIFGIIDECLYSVKYHEEETDEMDRVFDQWTNPVWLNDFFNEHIKDLQHGFFGEITVEQAVERTTVEAQELEDVLFELANNGQNGNYENLSHLFKPLSKGEMGRSYEKDKAYGTSKNSWLRLYAIRINVNVFVICGGAIKLTPTMNDRDHLLLELDKLETVHKFICENEEYADLFYELSL